MRSPTSAAVFVPRDPTSAGMLPQGSQPTSFHPAVSPSLAARTALFVRFGL